MNPTSGGTRTSDGRQKIDAFDRLPPIDEKDWNEAQLECAREIIDGPRGALISPFVPLLRSPEFCTHAQRMGEYLRYRSVLGLRLSELAILITAREWSQPVEWAIHAPIAEREGVARDAIEAIGEGRRPESLAGDEALLYDFSIELHRNRSVSDVTWQRAVQAFGEQGVVDLIGVNGYYSLLSMVMNAARTTVPQSPFRPMPNMPDLQGGGQR